MAIEVTREEALRDKAIRRLKKKRDFHTHVLVYVLVNAFLVAIWMATTCTATSGRSSPSSDGASAWS